MTYNNDNTTLKALLGKGSFIVIYNDAKKFIPTILVLFHNYSMTKKWIQKQNKSNYLVKNIKKYMCP